MHPWDQPPETLLELSQRGPARLLMPRLGEPVEPAHASGRVDPWWRIAGGAAEPLGSAAADKLPDVMPWPVD